MSPVDATALANAQLAQDVATAVAAKSKDVAEQQGEAAISMLEQSLELTQALNDVTGKGQHVDVIA